MARMTFIATKALYAIITIPTIMAVRDLRDEPNSMAITQRLLKYCDKSWNLTNHEISQNMKYQVHEISQIIICQMKIRKYQIISASKFPESETILKWHKCFKSIDNVLWRFDNT